MSYFGNAISIKDGANLDAFSRLRVSDTFELFSSMTEYGVNPYQWETAVSGGSSTFNANQNSATLSTGATTTGNYAIRQSRYYLRYHAGRSTLIAMTFCMGTARTNGATRIGYFDAENGIFLERSGTTVNIVRRSKATGSVVDTAVEKASWNIDKMDGTGPSGITLDLSKTQILIIDLQYLGVGRVRVGFDVNGLIYYVHQFTNANTTLTTVYMSTGCLPLRYEVRNVGTASAALTLDTICAVGLSEGASDEYSTASYSASNAITSKTAGSGTYTPLVGIQAKTAGPNSVANRGHINPKDFGVFVDGAKPIHYRLVLNPATITGASWTSVDTNSIANYDVSASAITGGIVISSGWLAASNQIKSTTGGSTPVQTPIVYTALGATQDVLYIVAAGIGGTSSCYGQINWGEEY